MSNKDNVGNKGETTKPWVRGNRQGKNFTPQPKKSPGEIPLLRFGNNNFYIFKEAMSKAALKDYGHLGKLIELEKYYDVPIPKRADYNYLPDADDNKMLYVEAIKSYTRLQNTMREAQPKLYGFIWQYLSAESMDEVKNEGNYTKFNDDKDPEGLWQAIVKTHGVNSISKVPEVLKRAARKEYQMLRQGGYESLIVYREKFEAALKTYKDQGNAVLDPKDSAMDFFDGLDPARYAQFKTDIHNGMTVGSIQAPATVNRVYELAANWIKTQAVHKQGVATTYVTTHLDKVERKPNNHAKPMEVKTPAVESEVKPQTKKKSDIECFNCRKKGHYANKCPDKKPSAAAVDEEDMIHTLNATWEASTFCTSTIHSAVDRSLKLQRDEVLLDTQADISIIHPSLLRQVQQTEREVKINGVGGLTLTVNKIGYLPDFFPVYSSEDTLANVLSFSEVEDKYCVTYIPQACFIVHLEH